MTSPTRPTVIIVHGLWHGPEHLSSFSKLLDSAQIKNHIVSVPSYRGAASTGIHADAKAIAEVIAQHLNDDDEVMLLAHSSAGISISEAIVLPMTKAYRTKHGQRGGVIGAALISAIVIPQGACMVDWFSDGRLTPWQRIENDCKVYVNDPIDIFYHDLPSSTATQMAKLLSPAPIMNYFDTVTEDGLHHIPCTHLFCTDDHAIPLFVQRMCVEKAEERGVKFVLKQDVHTSHSPYLSQPQKVIDFVLASADAFKQES